MFRMRHIDNKAEGVQEMLCSRLSECFALGPELLSRTDHGDEFSKRQDAYMERGSVTHLLADHEDNGSWNITPRFIFNMVDAGRTCSADSPMLNLSDGTMLHISMRWFLSPANNHFLEGVIPRENKAGTNEGFEYTSTDVVRETERLQDRASSPLRIGSYCDGSGLLLLEEVRVSTDWGVSHPLSISGGGYTIFS